MAAPPAARMTSGESATNSTAFLRMLSIIAPGPAGIDLHVAAIGPAQLVQAPLEPREAGFCLRIIHGEWYEHAYSPHPLSLLRACRKRPCRSAAEQRDELAPSHVEHGLPPAKGHSQHSPGGGSMR